MSTQNWQGKRILLTGATGSLGTETALALAALGAELLLPVRSEAKGSTLKTLLTQTFHKGSFSFFQLDMSDENSVRMMAGQICSEERPLDAIIHNAGVFTKAGLTSPQGHEWHQQVNALSPILLTKALLPVLQLSQQPAVVTVTSLSAFWSKREDPGTGSPTALYAASKRKMLTETLRMSQDHPMIRFVYAHPGVCATGLFAGTAQPTAYSRRFLQAALPLMRLLFPPPEKACATTVTALLEGKNGQLAEPSGPLHICGKAKLVPLTKRLRIL